MLEDYELDALSTNDRKVLNALLRLESEVGDPARPGPAFKTTRTAIFVEAEIRPISADASVYRLALFGVISKLGVPGKGTTIEILRRPARMA